LGDITISTDPARMDVDVIHGYLTRSYWAQGIPRETVARSLQHSMCFGAFDGVAQVGFARVVTDRATFAYIGDVFVLESHQGGGIGKRLMQAVMEHPELQGLRRWSLLTRDAHELYKRYGFTGLAKPDRYMEIAVPDIYTQTSKQ